MIHTLAQNPYRLSFVKEPNNRRSFQEEIQQFGETADRFHPTGFVCRPSGAFAKNIHMKHTLAQNLYRLSFAKGPTTASRFQRRPCNFESLRIVVCADECRRVYVGVPRQTQTSCSMLQYIAVCCNVVHTAYCIWSVISSFSNLNR